MAKTTSPWAARTRMCLAGMADTRAVGRAHSEAFADICPSRQRVRAAGVVDLAMRVEMGSAR